MRFAKTEFEYYENCFSSYNPHQHRVVGEGSVWYLFSREAIPQILTRHPAAKFIAMVRNPLEMVPSFHQKAFESLDEDVAHFPTAWELRSCRRQGKRIPPQCREPSLLDYGNVARLGEQIERFFALVPGDQRLVIVYDDFARNPRQTYQETIKFLGLPDDDRVDFPKINQNRRVYSQRLLQWAWQPPAVLRNIAERLRKLLRLKRLGVLPKIRSILVKNSHPSPLSEDIRKSMREEYDKDIELLERLLQRDLSNWRNP